MDLAYGIHMQRNLSKLPYIIPIILAMWFLT